MNATSLTESLQKAAPDAMRIASSTQPLGRVQRNCDRHGPYMAVGTRFVKLRRDIWGGCKACELIAERAERAIQRAAEERERAQRDQARVAEAIQHASIPERFKTRTLDNFTPTTPRQEEILTMAREYVADWRGNARAGRWMVFAGERGVGKSHIAIAILRALMPEHVGQYITCMGMIQAVRSTWERSSQVSETQVLRHFGSTPLLVLDEVGVQYGTEGEQTILFDVLDRRYRDMRPTILLTNEDLDGLHKFLGERLADRMRENTRWVPFDGTSYRRSARFTSYEDEANHE